MPPANGPSCSPPESRLVARRFVARIGCALRDHCGVLPIPNQAPNPAPRLLVAVSGGADSIAMLRALASLSSRRTHPFDLTVAHVHHGLRGADADADAQFVTGCAARLELPMMSCRLNLSESNGNLEAAARHARYAALCDMAVQAQAAYVVTAHHADDQLETVLMRLMRGASVAGLSAMPWCREMSREARQGAKESTLREKCDELSDPAYQSLLSSQKHSFFAPWRASREPSSPLAPRPSLLTLVRPMLAVTRDQIFEYLHTLEQDWREDHTNQDACRDRARLRRDVLPVLEDMHPGVAPKATALCDHLHDVAALLDDAVQRHAQLMVHHISDSFVQLDRRQARDMNQAVFIGLLRQLLEQQGVPADRLGLRSVEPILRAARDSHGGSRTFMFQGHVRLRLTRNAIIIERI